jgi:hypothetical protein
MRKKHMKTEKIKQTLAKISLYLDVVFVDCDRLALDEHALVSHGGWERAAAAEPTLIGAWRVIATFLVTWLVTTTKSVTNCTIVFVIG